ncbi:MAG: AhpC/TSA family protein [Niastella sp.]|nr:AhpC/TSA family protein [Niastella sp.]
MKKIILSISVIVLLFSCKSKTNANQFVIEGKLSNVPDQKVYLEQMFFSSKDPEVIDTAEMKDGKFEIKGSAPEEGLFRIRLEKSGGGFIFINDQPKISFIADLNDTSIDGPVFNSPANQMFKNFIKNIDSRGRELEQASKLLDSMQKQKGMDSAIAVQSQSILAMQHSFSNFINKYLDTVSNPVMAMFALGYSQSVEPEVLKATIPKLVTRFPKHQGIAALSAQFNEAMARVNQPSTPNARPGIPGVGDMAPDITMNDAAGKPFSLSSLKGKYVLVDFWASWCAPCRGENPNIVEAYKKYKSKNFTILGVSLDENKEAWQKAIDKDGLQWKQVSDLKGWENAAVPLYGFDGIPYNVLIDPNGKIIAKELRGSGLQSKLAELFK